ncbi:hypothetical protein RRG08_009723 [Elysia crispata]|uniref:Uncharacterized protein n=1 Tax=Elysia crispata TaxID=231223 RepID=A0AAE0Y8U9_9GAST|nr:hypothetical protein RRG08_009723 [Elysia crispata]
MLYQLSVTFCSPLVPNLSRGTLLKPLPTHLHISPSFRCQLTLHLARRRRNQLTTNRIAHTMVQDGRHNCPASDWLGGSQFPARRHLFHQMGTRVTELLSWPHQNKLPVPSVDPPARETETQDGRGKTANNVIRTLDLSIETEKLIPRVEFIFTSFTECSDLHSRVSNFPQWPAAVFFCDN